MKPDIKLENHTIAINNLNLCWVQHGGEAPWLRLIIKSLEELNIKTKVVTILRETDNELLSSEICSTFISSDVFDSTLLVSTDTIATMDMKYGPPGIRSIANGCMSLELLFGKNIEQRIQVVARALIFWEKYFAENHIDYLMVRETASYATRTAYVVGKTLGVPLMRGDIGPDDDHFTLTDVDEEAMWKELGEELSKEFYALNEEQRQRIDTFVEKRVPPSKGIMNIRPGGMNLKGLLVDQILSWVKESKINFKENPLAVSEQKMRRKFIRNRSMWKLLYKWAPYKKPAEERYVFIPLYFADEGMTRARYSFWSANIVPLVREIAVNLPVGYKLYLKEHPAVPGDLRPVDIWKLCRLPNVKLISPETQSQNLIRKASAVIVLQGTAGWETFLLRTPLIVLSANVYYTYSDLVYSVKDICMLSATLHQALKKGTSIYDDHEEEWYWFLHCILESSCEGCFTRYDFPYFQGANLENANLLAKGIANKVRDTLSRNSSL